MINKNDCMSILVRLGDEGLDVNKYIKQLAISKEVPLDVLRFISKNRGIEVANFYEMLRKSYNNKKSPLYINIVRGQDDIEELLITLSSLLTQINLYNKKLATKGTFIRDVRAHEISKAISKYYLDNDTELLLKLGQLIKSDLVVLEYIAGRRDIAE